MCFYDIEKNCIMDLVLGGRARIRMPECRLETVAQTVPTRQECLVSDVPSDVTAWWRGCAITRISSVPWARLVARKTGAI